METVSFTEMKHGTQEDYATPIEETFSGSEYNVLIADSLGKDAAEDSLMEYLLSCQIPRARKAWVLIFQLPNRPLPIYEDTTPLTAQEKGQRRFLLR